MSTVPRSAGLGRMPNGCVITRYAESSDFLYNGFAIRLRIFSCRLARSYFLFLFLPIVGWGAVKSNVTAENLGLCRQQCPTECAHEESKATKATTPTGASLSMGRIIVALPLSLAKTSKYCRKDENSVQRLKLKLRIYCISNVVNPENRKSSGYGSLIKLPQEQLIHCLRVVQVHC
jgi:hypothetical protein